MDKGKIIFDGPTHEGCVKYEEMARELRLDSFKKEENLKDNITNLKSHQSSVEEIEFLDIGILNSFDQRTDKVEMNKPLLLYCDFKVKKNLDGLYFSMGVLNEELRQCIWVMSNDNQKMNFRNIKEGKYRLVVRIANHHLIPSVYIPNIAIRNDKTGETYERILPECSFRVISDGVTLERGTIHVTEEWKLTLI